MKYFLTGLIILALVIPAMAQDKTFTRFELGANVTTPTVEGKSAAVVPAAMLKQGLVDNLFTLTALQTGFTSQNDTTSLSVGFGYQFPAFSLFSYKGAPVPINLDLIFARDLVNGFENNQLIGTGLRVDPLPDYNTAVMFRAFWNNIKVDGEWKVEWSFFGGLEYGIL